MSRPLKSDVLIMNKSDQYVRVDKFHWFLQVLPFKTGSLAEIKSSFVLIRKYSAEKLRFREAPP